MGVLRARRWRALRDAEGLSTARLADRVGLKLERVSALLCATAKPTPNEVAAIDAALGSVPG